MNSSTATLKEPVIELVRIINTDEYRFVLVSLYNVSISDRFVLYDATMPKGYKSVDVVKKHLEDFRKGLGKKYQLTRATSEAIRNLEKSL